MSSRLEQTYGIGQLDEVSKQVYDLLEFPVCLLKGELGAGKTTLLKSLLALYQVIDEISSPTYSIVNEYQTKPGETIYHFDLYRIKTEIELYDLGFTEYMESKNRCFIEWPDVALNMIPIHHHIIQIDFVNFEKRKLTLY